MPLPKRPHVGASPGAPDEEDIALDRALGLLEDPKVPTPKSEKEESPVRENKEGIGELELPDLDFDDVGDTSLATADASVSDNHEANDSISELADGEFLGELGIDASIFDEPGENHSDEPQSIDDWDSLLSGFDDEESDAATPEADESKEWDGETEEDLSTFEERPEEETLAPAYSSWDMPPDDAFEDAAAPEFTEEDDALDDESSTDEIEDNEVEEEPETSTASEPKNSPKKPRAAKSRFSPLLMVLAPFRKAYSFIVKGIFGGLKGLLRVLSHLPLVGGVFRLALQSVRVLEWVARGAPALVIAVAIFALNYFATPHSALIELPDSAAASFESFSYDEATGEAVGIVNNKGETVLYLSGAMTVWSMQPGLNPITWVQPQMTNKCTSTPIEIEAGDKGEIRVVCEVKNGFAPRVSGELIEE